MHYDPTIILAPHSLTLGLAPPAGGADAGGNFSAPGNPANEGSVNPDGGPGQTVPPPGGGGGNTTFLFIMVGLMAFMIIMTITSGRKQKKEREALMSGLKKHDKVLTSGGILGTITEMNDGEIVLRVDESSNTKIRFAKSAVTTVVQPGRSESSDADAE